MKKKHLPFLLLVAFTSINFLQSCKDDEEDNDPTPTEQEFVADDNTFADFANWSLDAEKQGIDPAMGAAHGGNDSTVIRKIYFKDGQAPVNGVYPKGTVIVKHSANDSTYNVITAMVKRGAGFNSANDGWEWFILGADGKIAKDTAGVALRGANLMNGMCAGCHTNATSDWVFSK
ncbi:MAG: cytochrome P460 family protein [Flavobacteriales bacterium]|nr:cytochrome P460 family protein [Flavobacteriales bacterium]